MSTILRKRGNTNVRVKSTWTQNPVNKDRNSTLLEINVSSYVVVVMIVVIESFRKAKDKTKESEQISVVLLVTRRGSPWIHCPTSHLRGNNFASSYSRPRRSNFRHHFVIKSRKAAPLLYRRRRGGKENLIFVDWYKGWYPAAITRGGLDRRPGYARKVTPVTRCRWVIQCVESTKIPYALADLSREPGFH